MIDWALLRESLWPLAVGMLRGTIPLTAVSFVVGLALAVAVALMRLSSLRVLAGLSRAYVSIIRGTPLLVQLFIVFYGLPSLGLTIPSWPAAVISSQTVRPASSDKSHTMTRAPRSA